MSTNGIADLDRIEYSGRCVEIGATARQQRVERDAVSSRVPLLGMASPWVGVYLTGRIAQFGRAPAGGVSRHMFQRFAASVGSAATSGNTPVEPGKPPSAVRLIAGMLLDRPRQAFRRRRR